MLTIKVGREMKCIANVGSSAALPSFRVVVGWTDTSGHGLQKGGDQNSPSRRFKCVIRPGQNVFRHKGGYRSRF